MRVVRPNRSEMVDRRKFNFLFRFDEEYNHNIVPVSFIDDIYYVLGNFLFETDEYLLIEDITTFNKCLEFSINFLNGKLNIVELSNIYRIITENNLSLDNFQVFKNSNILSKEHFSVLKNIYYLPDPLKKYIAIKDISIKTLLILVKFDKVVIDKISKLIEENLLSVSNFRNLINDIYDFYDEIDYKKPLLSEIKRCKGKIKNRYSSLNETIENILQLNGDVEFLNKNFYELCNFNISFEIKSYEDFCKKVDNLAEKKGKVKEVFSLLKNYDLC
jgi:hypothetical protein